MLLVQTTAAKSSDPLVLQLTWDGITLSQLSALWLQCSLGLTSAMEQTSEMLKPIQSSYTFSSKGCSQIKETKATLISETPALPLLCSRRPCADSSQGNGVLWLPVAVHRTLMMVSIFLLVLTPDSWIIYQRDHLNSNPCLFQGSANGNHKTMVP